MSTHRTLALAATLLAAPALLLLAPTADAQRARTSAQQKGPQVESIPVLKSSGRVDPKPKLTQQVAKPLQKAIDLYNDDKVDEALKVVNEQLAKGSKLTPYEMAKLYQLQAQLLAEKDDNDGAIEAARKSLSDDGLPNTEYLDGLQNLAILLSNGERYAESNEVAERWAADAPKLKGGMAAMVARNHYDLEQYDQAVSWIEKAFATGDEPQRGWYQIKVNSLYSLERYDDAIAFLNQVLAREPGQADFLNMLVNSHIEKEDYQSALNVLLDALAKGQLSSETQYVQIYQLYQYLEQNDKAAEALEGFLGEGKITASAKRYIDLGEAQFQAEKMDQALASFRKAAELSQDGTADAWVGAILLEQQKYADAKQALETAFRKGSLKHEGNAHYNLALVKLELNDEPGARASAQKALEFDTTRSAAQALLKNLDRGR